VYITGNDSGFAVYRESSDGDSLTLVYRHLTTYLVITTGLLIFRFLICQRLFILVSCLFFH